MLEADDRVKERVRIDLDLCDGCGVCVDSCPTDVLRVDEATKRAVAVFPQDCHTCFLCQDDCPKHCIAINASFASPRNSSIYDLLKIV